MSETVPVDQLKPFPGNAKFHDLDIIADSLRVNSQYQPIIVQAGTMYVVAGNGTLEAARDLLGWEQIEADVLDLSEAEALRLNVQDNRARELGVYDPHKLRDLIAPLAEAGRLEGSGHDLDSWDALIASLTPPSDLPDPGGDNPHAETDEERAAREKSGGPPPDSSVPAVRPLLLMFTGQEHARYVKALNASKQGDETPAMTVLRVLRAAS